MRELTRRLLLYTLILAGLVLAGPAQAVTLQQAEQAKRTGQRVYDLAGVLSPDEAKRLTAQLARMEKAGLAQGAVVILDRTEGGTSVKEYATDLLKRWGVGQKATDNGFVLVVSVGDR